MKCIINAHGVVSDSLQGPLAPYIGAFSKSVSSQGYSFKSVGDKTRIGAFFSRWLGQKRVQLHDVSIERESGFYRRVQAEQFQEQGIRRTVARADQVSHGRGRLELIQGNVADDWGGPYFRASASARTTEAGLSRVPGFQVNSRHQGV